MYPNDGRYILVKHIVKTLTYHAICGQQKWFLQMRISRINHWEILGKEDWYTAGEGKNNKVGWEMGKRKETHCLRRVIHMKNLSRYTNWGKHKLKVFPQNE